MSRQKTLWIVAVVLLILFLVLRKPASATTTPSITGAGAKSNPLATAVNQGSGLLGTLKKLLGGGGSGNTVTVPVSGSTNNGPSSSTNTGLQPSPDAFDAAGNPLFYDDATSSYYYGDGVPADTSDIYPIGTIPGFTPQQGTGFDSTINPAGTDDSSTSTDTSSGDSFDDWENTL